MKTKSRVEIQQAPNDAADQQPWRCVKCGEAVNKTTKRDCLCTRAVDVGAQMARVVFDKRSEGRPYRTTEAHLSEVELGAMLSIAYEKGAKDKRALAKVDANREEKKATMPFAPLYEECSTCIGYGHFDESDEPTVDRRGRKCGTCGGEGRVTP